MTHDDRFDPQQPHLMSKRCNNHSETDEPIRGFVRIPAGEFTMGSKVDKDNPLVLVEIEKDFYISRTLVTVEQYSVFMRHEGYKNDAWWDRQGIEWRAGAFASKVKDWECTGNGLSAFTMQGDLAWQGLLTTLRKATPTVIDESNFLPAFNAAGMAKVQPKAK